MHERVSGVVPAVYVTFACPSQELPRLVEPPGQAASCIKERQEFGSRSTHEACAKARMMVIGGGGHLGRTKIEPALLEMEPGIADCLERTAS